MNPSLDLVSLMYTKKQRLGKAREHGDEGSEGFGRVLNHMEPSVNLIHIEEKKNIVRVQWEDCR